MYKKVPRNVYTVALSRLINLAETTTDDLDEIDSFLPNNEHLAYVKLHHEGNHSMLHKLR